MLVFDYLMDLAVFTLIILIPEMYVGVFLDLLVQQNQKKVGFFSG